MNVSALDRKDWVGAVVTAHRQGRPLALLFDYDGTLTPIVHHPSLARLSQETRQLLMELRDLRGVHVGVISGRSLQDVRELVGLPGLFYGGSGGLELDLYGERLTYPGADLFRGALQGIAEALVRIVSGYPGAWVEHKSVTCSLHFRSLTPLRALAFQQEVFALLNSQPGIHHRVVSQAIEVTPADGWDKGTAVAALLSRLEDGALPVYAGDAANDAEAMAVTSCLGGIAIGVGPDAPSLATHRVRSPRELAEMLDRLVSRLAQTFASALALTREEEDYPVDEDTLSENATVAPGDLHKMVGEARPGILVVDADPQVRSQTANGLRSEGWRVWEAGEVGEAVGILRRQNGQVKAAIVDLQMPGIQGWRVLSELGATNPSLIRCATSAGVSAQAADAYRNSSDTPLFVRPFRVEMVSAELHRLLGLEGLE